MILGSELRHRVITDQSGALYFPIENMYINIDILGGGTRKTRYCCISLFMTWMLWHLHLTCVWYWWSWAKHNEFFFTHHISFSTGSIYWHKSSNSLMTNNLLYDAMLCFLIYCFQGSSSVTYRFFIALIRYCLPPSSMRQLHPLTLPSNIIPSQGKDQVCLKCRRMWPGRGCMDFSRSLKCIQILWCLRWGRCSKISVITSSGCGSLHLGVCNILNCN